MSSNQLALSTVFIKCVFWCGLAYAQEAGNFAVEGHIFDVKTRKPLANAYVSYTATLADGRGGGVSVYSNPNGFYQLEFIIFPETPRTVDFFLLCRTKRGDIKVFGQLYGTLREVIYQRDFYVTMPKNTSKCEL